jgi:murein DD-endopeptidase MepM/ murein hydrolase activator NlpD
MNLRQRRLLVVPPDSRQVRTLRIRSWHIVSMCAIVGVGLSSFFFSFSSFFTISETEKNQRHNLGAQNSALSLRVSKSLKPAAVKPPAQSLPQRHSSIALPLLIASADSMVQLFSKLTRLTKTSQPVFDQVPVIVPVDYEPVVANMFGKQHDPFTGELRWHYGVDLIAAPETAVFSAAQGRVSLVQNDRNWGRKIVITHECGYSTVYAHLGSIRATTGQNVRKGEWIASVGLSGNTSGPHLHYEIWRNGRPVDPLTLFFPNVDSLLYAGVIKPTAGAMPE